MSEAILENKTKQKITRPPKYCVVMFNDNLTTQEFVVDVIIKYYNKTEAEAEILMNQIHVEGKAIVGKGYDLDIAKTKVKKTTIYAQSKNFPLKAEVQTQEGES